ncbi:FLYWCH zinc finger domain-containing protein [Ditylenchus destructor]|uniref:FLYWCH zinc finger domain-containing protein n=1 Tax=Ditylenchus destructor TaxID=166010 RepID=A0AAD4MFC2_9BILA|nr:FLYWCH zinc finger domain-containing protein [Ditylenchus destructor]
MEYDFPPQVRQIPNPVTPQEEVFVKSKRAGDKLSHEGHLYWFSKKSSRCDIWVCDRRKSERCPARIQTNMQKKVIRELHQHNHETNGARKFVHKVKQRLRDRAKDTVEEPSQIISTVASNQPDYVKAHLPKKHALKHIIRRQRDELVRPPPVPDSADLYVIPDRYRMYSPHPGTAEQFLLADSGDHHHMVTIPDIQRILILGRSSIRQWIHLVKKIYIDGTLKIAPFHFNQASEEGRTNNHAEAAHRRLQTELAHDHPTLWALIDGLKKAQAARDVEYEEFVRGDAPPQKRQKFQLADARVLAILEDYENRTHIEILKGISQSYGMI